MVILCKRHQIRSHNSSSSFRLFLLVDLSSLAEFDRVVVCDRKISIFGEGFDSNCFAWYYINLGNCPRCEYICIDPHHFTFSTQFPRPLQALLPSRFSPTPPFHASSENLSAKLYFPALATLECLPDQLIQPKPGKARWRPCGRDDAISRHSRVSSRVDHVLITSVRQTCCVT